MASNPSAVLAATPGAGAVVMPVDVPALEAYCVANIPGFKAGMLLGQFGLGQSNPTYVIIDGSGRHFIMRKKPPGKHLSPTLHNVAREFRVLDALARGNTGYASPRPYTLCTDEAVIGSDFYVMEYIGPGRIQTLEITLPGARDAAERRAMWVEYLRKMAELHRIDYKKIGLSGFGKDSGYFPRNIANWARLCRQQAQVKSLIDGSVIGEPPMLDEIVSWLEKNCIPDEASIMHGDFNFHNVMFDPAEPRIIAVLDWELCTIGHPLADLGMPLASFHAPGFRPPPGTPSPEEVMAIYCAAAGRKYPIEGVAFIMAFKIFTLLVISQGIAVRYHQKQNASPRAKNVAENWKTYADFTLKLMGYKHNLSPEFRLGAHL
ncbi:kinase-like domain-containing protein [Hyaloraphidium curvatum]|nr:kinase-like domain-containing protein [Hyaloraphidium curvatum]